MEFLEIARKHTSSFRKNTLGIEIQKKIAFELKIGKQGRSFCDERKKSEMRFCMVSAAEVASEKC